MLYLTVMVEYSIFSALNAYCLIKCNTFVSCFFSLS